VGCSGLQFLIEGCSGLHCVAVGCNVLQWVAVSCNVLQWVAVCDARNDDKFDTQWVALSSSVLQCVMRVISTGSTSSVLQCVAVLKYVAVRAAVGGDKVDKYCVAVCCRVLQSVCCSVLQWVMTAASMCRAQVRCSV